MKHLVIDGNNLLFRCYWSAYKKWHEIKPSMYGYFFLNVIKSYVNLFSPDDIIVTWDERKGQDANERKVIAEDYKANREYNADVFEFIDDIREILDYLGVRQMYPLNREGDDIMYWLCAVKFPNTSILVSTDTDMYQMVRDEFSGNIIYNPSKKIQVTPMFLKSNYDVDNGKEFIVKKALKGDKSDNILGIKGIRKGRVRQIVNCLGDEMDMERLKGRGILTDEEYDIFSRNLELMLLDKLLSHKDEMDFYEEQMSAKVYPDKVKFKEKAKEMTYWSMYKSADSWYELFAKNCDDYLSLF